MNDELKSLLFEELQHHCHSAGFGGFLPAVKQVANVAALPGIVKVSVIRDGTDVKYGKEKRLEEAGGNYGNIIFESPNTSFFLSFFSFFFQKNIWMICFLSIFKHSIGLPDLHSGYGFAIGNVAACKLLSLHCSFHFFFPHSYLTFPILFVFHFFHSLIQFY